jgi:hypothetical protein
MGTSEVKSRVKVLENIALQPSPSLLQCSCDVFRYKIALKAVGRNGPVLISSRTQKHDPSSSKDRLIMETDTWD